MAETRLEADLEKAEEGEYVWCPRCWRILGPRYLFARGNNMDCEGEMIRGSKEQIITDLRRHRQAEGAR